MQNMAPPRVREQGAPTYQLVIREVFDRLPEREQLYAHYLSKAAWDGTGVLIRQVSSEANGIFDFIIELYNSYGGQWATCVKDGDVTEQELSAFLDYAALFLTNLGNYFVSVVP